jgi:hypothetical protein
MVYISLVAAVLFILLIVVASGNMDGMSGRYGVMFTKGAGKMHQMIEFSFMLG